MGISDKLLKDIGKLAGQIIADVNADKIEKAVDKLDGVLRKIEDKANEAINPKKEKYFKKYPDNNHLLLIGEMNKRKSNCVVYDESCNGKYAVCGEWKKKKHFIHVYDIKDKEIGNIAGNLVLSKKMLSKYVSSIKEQVFIHGQTEVSIEKTSTKQSRNQYNISRDNWHIEEKQFGKKYIIYNDIIEVAHIELKYLISQIAYVIDFKNKEDEVVVLMITLAIDGINRALSFEEQRTTSKYDNEGYYSYSN